MLSPRCAQVLQMCLLPPYLSDSFTIQRMSSLFSSSPLVLWFHFVVGLLSPLSPRSLPWSLSASSLIAPSPFFYFYFLWILIPSSSFSVSTLLVFKVLWFVSLQTLMSSRGKISTGITSKHQHRLHSSSPALLPSTFLLCLLYLTSFLHFMAHIPFHLIPLPVRPPLCIFSPRFLCCLSD